MSQIKFSQKSIQGLPEALTALVIAAAAQGTSGATALVDAINTEVTARNTAISTAITTEVAARNTAIDTAIQTVLGAAPDALNTLKEIADYITVNPNATVADAINAAIAAAQQAVTDLTAVVSEDRAYFDYQVQNMMQIKDLELDVSALDANGKSAFTTPYLVDFFSNFNSARFTHPTTGVKYDVEIAYNNVTGEGTLDFAGLETEVSDALAGGVAKAKAQAGVRNSTAGFNARASYYL
jgi:hypothetical protein